MRSSESGEANEIKTTLFALAYDDSEYYLIDAEIEMSLDSTEKVVFAVCNNGMPSK